MADKSFFSTLPGILTGIAGVITALVALIYALHEIGLFEARNESVANEASAGPAVTPDVGGNTTDGWAIIGFAQGGKYSDLKVMVHGESPAIGGSYDVVDDFRLVLKDPREKGRDEQVITIGMVRRGDSVEILDLYIEPPSTKRQPVYAKLQAALDRVNR